MFVFQKRINKIDDCTRLLEISQGDFFASSANTASLFFIQTHTWFWVL